MATIKITSLGHLSNADIAPGDVFVIDHISTPITKKLTVANLTSYISTTLGNLESYASYANSTISNLSLAVGDTAQLVTTDKSNLVAAINEVASNTNFNAIVFGGYTLSERVTDNVSSLGADIFSMSKASKHFAKLLINVEDLTYGQYQTSELLLIQDGTETKLVEYGIVFTSTNPLVSYDSYLDASNVVVRATATSSDNRIRVLQITS
jgi:hypothetical protein